MRTLIVVNHGEWDDRLQQAQDDKLYKNLTDRGKGQMRKIAEQLKPLIEDKNAVVLASSLDAAVMSAEIICSEIGLCGFERHIELFSFWNLNFMQPVKLSAADKLLKRYAGDEVVVIVSDLRFALHFPKHFIKKTLCGKPTKSSTPQMVRHGEAVVIDCDQKTARLLCPAS